MKKVLILSYYFPPLALGGTQRMAKFAKYLPENGWQPTVITVKDIFYWARDESLLMDVEHTRIIRTGSLDPQRLLFKLKEKVPMNDNGAEAGKASGLMHFINRRLLPFFCIPDSKRLWNPFAWKAVKKLLQSESFDAVISTGPPFSTHLLASRISKKFHIPWIADFRDDWAGGHVVHEPTFIQRWLNRLYQNRVIKNAHAVISVSPGIERELKKASSNAQFHLITNGFDPDDIPVSTKSDNFFNLVYCGVISKFSEPGGLFRALKQIRQEHPDKYRQFKLQIVGHDAKGDLQKQIDEFQLQEFVDIVGFLPHDQALQYVADASALLLIATGTAQDTFIPGKTFEYLGAKKPILCASNVRDTSEMLRQYKPATVVMPDDPKQIVNAVLHMMDTPKQPDQNDLDFIAQFDRRQQTRKLAEILNSL